MYGLRSVSFLLVVLLVGCVSAPVDDKPVHVYGGPERPADQVAMFECGFGINVRAIDGNSQYQGKAILCKFVLLPGPHEFRVNLESLDTKRGGTWRSEKDYLVPLRLVAGRTYVLHAFLDRDIPGNFPWRVKLADSSKKEMIDLTNLRVAP